MSSPFKSYTKSKQNVLNELNTNVVKNAAKAFMKIPSKEKMIKAAKTGALIGIGGAAAKMGYEDGKTFRDNLKVYSTLNDLQKNMNIPSKSGQDFKDESKKNYVKNTSFMNKVKGFYNKDQYDKDMSSAGKEAIRKRLIDDGTPIEKANEIVNKISLQRTEKIK